MATGLRVIRGPDWSAGDKDGGDGHVGTVVSYRNDETAEVIWDNGNQTISSTGKDNKFELIVLDNAPVGIRHAVNCDAYHEEGVFGMRWRCNSCPNFNLCSICYVRGKHDLDHQFIRYDTPKSDGVKVPARNKSMKVNALGIFPGANVVRGIHWELNDVDGGRGMTGEVVDFVTLDSKSPRSAVSVSWQSGETSTCRVGYQGKVDIQYCEEAPGVEYYPQHLPVLEAVAAKSPIDMTQNHAQFRAGDSVTIKLDEISLREVMNVGSGWNSQMAKCIGQLGVIKSFASNGEADVEFGRRKYRLPPKVLRKIAKQEPGSVVRIIDDKKMVKMFQEDHGGWVDDMASYLGKVVRVKKIDADGDVVVLFGKRKFLFSPACCLPVSESDLPSESDNGIGISISDIAKAFPTFLDAMKKTEEDNSDAVFSDIRREIFKRDLAEVKRLVTKCPKVTTKKEQGLTCLHIAVREGYLSIVKFLVESHSNINEQDKFGDSPLLVALARKNTEVAEYLVRVGAKTEIANDKHQTALFLAAYTDQATVVDALIQKGVDVNVTDEDGDTPLHVAIMKDRITAAQSILMAPNLDLRKTNKKGHDPLHMAAGLDRTEIVEKILHRDRSFVNFKKDDDGYTALHIATVNNKVDVGKVLLRQGASVNSKAEELITPLHIACIQGHLEFVQLLVSAGANVNAGDVLNRTPFHMLMDPRMDEVKKITRQTTSNVDTKVKIVTCLLQHGANKDARDITGSTPIGLCKDKTLKDVVLNFKQISKSPSSHVSSSSSASADVLCDKCLNITANTILLPCSHKVICHHCCHDVRVCPVCEQDVKKIIGEDGEMIVNHCLLK